MKIPMKHAAAIAFIIQLFCAAPRARCAEGTCWVVAIAMNQYDKDTIDIWDQYAVEFAKTFVDNASTLHGKVQTRVILGKEATRPNILNALNWLTNNAGPKDFVAFYIGCHGGTAPAEGWSVDTMDNKIVSGKDLKSVAAKIPSRVLFVIDTCGSGGFAHTHPKDIPLPPNCVAICSCRAQQSTTNHLNTALHEGLWGKADFNKDGYVTVEELIKYIKPRAKELVKANADENELPVIECGQFMPGDFKLTKDSNKLVALAYQGDWYLGRLDKEEGDKCKVHVMGYDDDPKHDFFFFNEIEKSHCFKMELSGPQPVKVSVNDKKRLAMITGKEGENFKVEYPLIKNAKKREAVVEKSAIEFLFCSDPAVAPLMKK